MLPTGEAQQGAEIARYLTPGKQTAITPAIQQLSSTIQGGTLDKAQSVLGLVKKLQVKKFDDKLFRKRTGDQIINDGFVTGCTDAALAFVTVARASGLPTKYVETIDRKWLTEGGGSIGGHIYAQVYDEQKKSWIWVDPLGNKVDVPAPYDRVVYKEGLDSWDIGIIDFQSLQTQFETFRKTWLESQQSHQ